MGVTTNSTPTSDYTWDNALFSWDAPINGDMTWDSAVISAHVVDVTEAAAISELGARSPNKRVSDSVAVAEKPAKKPTKKAMEAFSVADSLKNVSSFYSSLVEAISIADSQAFVAGLAKAETLRVDERAVKSTSLALKEVLGASSSLRSWASYFRTVSEAITAVDKRSSQHGKKVNEAFRVLEQYKDVVAFVRSVDEALAFAETYQDNINFKLGFSESFGFSDGVAKDASKPLSESIAVADKRSSGIALKKGDSLAVQELFASRSIFYRFVAEAVRLAEANGKTVDSKQSESLSVASERLSKGFGKKTSETLAFLELAGRAGRFKRAFSESVQASDAIKKAMGLKAYDAVKLGEEFLRGADGVIDELAVLNTALSIEEFAKLLVQDSPSSYSEFRRLLPGDYEYQDALVRVLVSSENGDRAVINDLNLLIDVPDVTDRGRVTCSASSATYVTFARTFLEPPEVALTVAGGATGVVLIPRIIGAITTNGFTVGLFKTDGTMADGSVSWNATGY